MAMRSATLAIGLLAAALLVGCPPPGPAPQPGKGKAKPTATPAKPTAAPTAVAAKDRVPVELYIMSKCPYGARAAIPMIDAAAELGGLVDVKFDYIVTVQGETFRSLHGPPETEGNIYQLCAKQVDESKFFPFIKCVSENYREIPGNSEACAKKLGLDFAALRTCAEGPEGKRLLTESAGRAKAAGARGSPTIKLGGKAYRGGRGKRDFMRAVCGAAKVKTAVCAAIPPPAKVNLTILSDARCKKCDTARYESQLKVYFPGLEVKKLDYATPEGKALYAEAGVERLPVLLFDETVTKAEAYKQFQRRMRKQGKYYTLRVRAEFDPKAEICDNKKDDTGNGLVDCADPTCKQTLECREEKKGELSVFVMSQCPYGVRALDAMKEVLDALGDGIDFNIHYIADKTPTGFKALHGQAEVDENIRQLCAIKHYPKGRKYMEYIWCRNKDIRGKDWQKCTGSNGIATDVIQKRFEGDEGKKLHEEDIAIAKALRISASPTWLANNRFKFSGIQPEQIKQQFCKRNPGTKGCDKKLSSSQKAPPAGACGK